MPAGRPTSEVPQDKADSLVEWLEEGKTLRSWCRIPGNPCKSTITNWEKKDDEFRGRIACARETGEDAIAEECIEIADDGSNDYMEQDLGDGVVVRRLDPENIQRSRLRVDTRLKLLAKWNPRKWGEKIQQEVTGKDGGPVQAHVVVEFVKTGEK